LENFPSFDEVSPFKELLYQRLRDAIIDTNRHFKESGHRYNAPSLFARHVSSLLHDNLETEAANYGFAIDTSTGAFLIYYKQFIIRFYKACKGVIPQNRDSKAWRCFINHNRELVSIPELPGFEGLGGSISGTKVHVVAYYEVDAEYELLWLRMTSPRSITSAGIDCVWNEEVEISLAGEGTQSQQQSTGPRPDLPFILKEGNNSFAEDDDSIEDDNDATELGS